MINLLCDRALMVGCEKQTSRIAEEHVVAAASQLGIEVPKNKIKGEKATPTVSASPRRTLIAAAATVIVALAGATVWFLGNPLELFGSITYPSVRQQPTRQLPAPANAMKGSADMPAPAVVPAPIAGSFSVMVGTYDNARQSQIAEARIRDQKLEPYLIDIVMGLDDVQRRILVGRFPTREEAEAVRQKLAPTFPTARVILGAQERLRLLGP
ncbi:MAG: SPOR domain-containing protein [Acidimicrobiia bacterium]